MAAQQWEYLVIRLTDARPTHISERLNQHAAEGYEPIMMCGDATLSLLLRRPKEETPAPAES